MTSKDIKPVIEQPDTEIPLMLSQAIIVAGVLAVGELACSPLYFSLLKASLALIPWAMEAVFMAVAFTFVVGFALLYFYLKKRKFNGDITLRYLIWYGAGRFWIEGLRTDSLLLVPSIGLRVSQLVAGIAVVGGVIAEILLTRKFRDKPLMVELPLNSENRARMKKLDGPITFAGTDAALPASASRAEFVEKTAAWNETVKKALDRRERPEKNEKNPE